MSGALAPDRAAHRDWLVSFAALADGAAAADLGCGRGEDLLRLAASNPHPGIRLVGVDASEAGLAAAASAARGDPRLSFVRAPLGGRLPFADASLDLVYSHNLLECLPDPAGFAREAARVLRPGGQVVTGHWDWDTQLFDASDKTLVRRLVAAYADWQQAWMQHADGWMGRRLWGIFNQTGCFDGAVHARVLTNTAYEAPWFGHENAQAFRALAKRGLATADDVERLERDQLDLHARGRYFYSITGFAYAGRRSA